MSQTDPMADIKTSFFLECEELIEEAQDGFQDIQSGHGSLETLHSIFRAIHSIKGGAAAFGFSDLTEFAHRFETRLETLRKRQSVPDEAETAQLLLSMDRLTQLVGMARDGQVATDEERLDDAAMLAPALSAHQPIAGRLAPSLELINNGLDARDIIAVLRDHGTLELTPDVTSLPNIDLFDPAAPTLAWDALWTPGPDATKSALLEALPAGHGVSFEEVAKEAAPKPAAGSGPKSSATATIRVDLDRIDRLMNLVGELVINQAMLTQSAGEIGAKPNSAHAIGLEEFLRLTRDLQDSVMQIRAQPIKPLFHRMGRICREAAGAEGLEVDYLTEGQDTEIDKTVIERLAEPLTHMIRNAIAHGIEPVEDRRAAGKPDKGRIRLSAQHRSGQVIIEVTDDGRGIDRNRVRQRAEERALIAPDADLTDSEIDALLFEPGFSTASEVSDLSGRGVGMDVVRNAIHGLGGRLTLESVQGEGTTFTISLPLTLAVLESMVVRVADQTLVIPLNTIQETGTLSNKNLVTLGGQLCLRHDGQVITTCDLGHALGYRDRLHSAHGHISILISQDGKTVLSLIVDQILEQRQVVIKGLQEGFTSLHCIAAATILGDGKIALIVDPYDLVPGTTKSATQSAVPLELTG